jgi:hypothetical protein
VVVVVDGRFEVTVEREEVDGVLDTVAGGTEAPDDIVNSAALVARTVRDVVVKDALRVPLLVTYRRVPAGLLPLLSSSRPR